MAPPIDDYPPALRATTIKANTSPHILNLPRYRINLRLPPVDIAEAIFIEVPVFFQHHPNRFIPLVQFHGGVQLDVVAAAADSRNYLPKWHPRFRRVRARSAGKKQEKEKEG